MSIANLLSKPVSTLPPTATCAEAARRMRRENLGCVVVEKDGAPIGIVTDRDLVLRVVAEEIDPSSVLVSSVMSQFPAFLTEQRDLGEAVRVMREMGVRRLPAINSHGRAVGMLSLDDVLIELSEQMDQIKELLRSEAKAAEPKEGPIGYAGVDV